MDKFDREHAHNIAAYQKRVQDILNEYEKDITRLASAITVDGDRPISFSDYPALKARYDRLIRDLSAEMRVTVENGEKVEWGRADAKNDALAVSYTGSIANAALAGYLARNNEALEAFSQRKVNGLDLSGRVWNITDQFSTEIQDAIDIALRDHLTADELSREVRRYLKNPDALFRRVRDEYGVLHLSKRAKAYHPGQGVYRSAYMNARRLAATEINMAYRTSDDLRREKLDFVVGIEVHLSNNHNCKGVPPGQFYDICDELQGKYPKDFKFTGWHPFCYDDKSEVYTDSGWKLFKDVKDSDLILSLNPETRDLEYTGILLNISRPYKGKMVHFHNRSYSQLVTPEHEVLYVSKNDGRTFKRMSAEKCGKSQPIYRSSEWKGEKHNAIEIGTKKLDFLLFARFMGYWLSDGSLGHKYSVSIAQQDANRENIYKCINEMGFRARYNGGKVEFNDQSFYEYLLRLGKAADKYVPQEIKEGTAEEIRAFLYAFISCDGHIREPKPFIGNRGSICIPSEGEKTYSTTSRRMADDIGELILKTGRRPSFSVQRTAGKTQRFHNGTYTINHDIITIRECRSLFATQYSKDYVDYDGMVYDLTLAKNNTMYIRRNGKCFWGSNCRCYTTTILKTREEMREDTRRRLKGGQPSKDSVNSVKELPENFVKWLEDNGERIGRAKSLPYFLKDNGRMVDGVWEPYKKVEAPHEPTLLEIAAKRHAERTPEQAQAIRDRWARKQAEHELIRKTADDMLKEAMDYGETDYSGLQAAINAGNLNKMKSLSSELKKAVSDIKAQETAISGLIPNAHALHRKYSMGELKDAYSELDGVMKKWLSKYGYASLDAAPPQHLKNKLDFELSNPSVNYSNKDIVKQAITEKMRLIDRKIEWDGMVQRASALKSFKTRSSVFKNHISNIDEAIRNDDFDLLKKSIAEAEKQQQKLLDKQIKRGGDAKTALNKEYKGGATGKDMTSSVNAANMVSEDPYRGTYTNNVARLQGFDAPAKLVTESEFAMLEKACGEVFYRTVNPTKFNGKNMTGEEFASQMYVADRLELNGPGGRAYGDGIYVATSSWDGRRTMPLTDARKQDARYESACYGNGRHKTSEMTWTRKPKIILQRDLHDMWSKLTPIEKKKYGGVYSENTYACALGYDGMYCEGPNYMVIWNRSIIAVKNM